MAPSSTTSLIDFSQRSLWISVASIAFNPIYWNFVARNEYRNKTITKVLGGNTYMGCYILAVSIFSLGIFRDFLYRQALVDQPTYDLIDPSIANKLAYALFGFGQLLVLSSTWALGITGTYLGDYFGILMDHRVEGFPFNLFRDPMYNGSTMCFIAMAIWHRTPAGLVISTFVHIVYTIALKYEGPFTDMIYANKAKSGKKSH